MSWSNTTALYLNLSKDIPCICHILLFILLCRSNRIFWGQTDIVPSLGALHPHYPAAPAGAAPAKPSCFAAAATNERHDEPGPKRGRLRQRQRPAVVRELHLCQRGTAAALLLADGAVWWVSDLAVGRWAKVTEPTSLGTPSAVVPQGSLEKDSVERGQQDETPRGGAGADPRRNEHGRCFQSENEAEGVTQDGRLLTKGVSAIAVVGWGSIEGADVVGVRDARGAGECSQMHCGGGAGVEALSECGDTGSCSASIVVGRDDGWLFILTQQQQPSSSVPVVDGDRGGTEESPIPAQWRVSEKWKGHNARVTSVWPAGCRASAGGGAGDSMPIDALTSHTAALDTSRLRAWCHGSLSRHGFNGALVSAAADGTVGWWAWPHDHCCGSSSAARKEQRLPPLRMVRA